jgi:uncharacterized protein (TIGR03086 family)
MTEIADRYRTRADAFQRKLQAVHADQWSNPSPCEDWSARDVVGHIVVMHAAMLQPLGGGLSPAPSVDDDPVEAFTSARADVEALLDNPDLAAIAVASPAGPMTAEQHVDQVVSEDMVVHGWDLARATGQDDTIDPAEVERMWPSAQEIPEVMRIPDAFGPGIVVYGPEITVPDDASLQDRLLGRLGRDPAWRGS